MIDQRIVDIEPKLPQGWFSEYDMQCILPYLEALGPDDLYLEIGTHKGRSLYFARKFSKAHVYGVDIVNTLDHKFFRGLDYGYEWGGSDFAATDWTDPISLLLIDGEHSYEGSKKDWDNWSKFIKPGGTVFFHDCDETSEGVVQLFEEIKQDPLFTDFTTYKTKELKTSMASCRRVE